MRAKGVETDIVPRQKSWTEDEKIFLRSLIETEETWDDVIRKRKVQHQAIKHGNDACYNA